jgi:hypothetical protein
MTCSLALYKGNGNYIDSIVRVWTKSPYSHCELVVDGKCFSSSPQDGGVRDKLINLQSGGWDLIELPWADDNKVLSYFNSTAGQTYGWASLITSQVFNLGISNDKSQFCSEWCANALGIPNPSAYNPQTLAELCGFLNEIGG